MKLRQKEVRFLQDVYDLGKHPSNSLMECDNCRRVQKNRAFCYFCLTLNQSAQCANCGKIKCMSKFGDCLIKHPGTFCTGLSMVGAICDHCEAFICHSRRCLSSHGCVCPLQDAICLECQRNVWSHGGRIFKCAFCNCFLCEDDQFEHQASCQKLSRDDYKCGTCNRIGQLVCLNCKVTFCDEHVRRKGQKISDSANLPCPKCSLPTKEVYQLSLTAKKYQFGKQECDNKRNIFDSTMNAEQSCVGIVVQESSSNESTS